MKLSLQSVHKSFGSRRVLDGISLEVSESEVIALIGASGSGKSTLLRCINLLEPIDDGRILLDGVDISEPGLPADAIRRRIGMVFQSFNLFPHMSVLRNVALAPHKVLGIERGEAEERARALLSRFGLADRAESFPDQLSGGQQQRVAIARSLAMEPEVMLLDEITSALDPELVGEVLRVVEALADEGMTLLMVTHEMGFARKVSDRVVFMHEVGPPETLFRSPQTPELQQFLASVDR